MNVHMDVRKNTASLLSLVILAGAAVAPMHVTADEPARAARSAADASPTYGKPGWQEDFAARSIVRAGLLDLRLRPSPAADDYRILLDVLNLAEKYSPKDTDIIRRRIEAAAGAGDSALVESATRALVELDPSDTVAQLRLISSRIASLQTVEERLRAYGGFLGERGAGLDGSVRSRLALDAALLRRETGDMDGFSEALRLALTFDSTNKAAALLALEHYTERVADPVGKAQLVSNLLLSDPLDPNVHRQFSMALASGGAFAQAKRFHTIADSLQNAGGVSADNHFAVEEWMLIWANSGPSAMLDEMDNVIVAQKYQARVAEEHAKKELRPVTRRESDVVLAPPLERIRLFAADAAQDQKELEASRAAIVSGCGLLLQQLDDFVKKPPADFPIERLQEAKAAAVTSILDFQLLRLLTNVDVDKVPEVLSKCRGVLGDVYADLSSTKAIEAWLLLRSGKNEEALAAFNARESLEFEELEDRSVGELEPIRIGKALLYETMGQATEAATIYREIAADRPLDGSGLWCRNRLEKMGGIDASADAVARKLTSIAQSVPAIVEELSKNPSSMQSVTADVPATVASSPDRSDLIIRFRNRTRIPLGLGADRAINSRLLVQPSVDIHTFAQTTRVRPEVLELDRRFRLMPGETLQLQVRADAGFTGWIIESGASKVVRSRFRLLQGFTPSQEGNMVAGPGCVAADSPQVIRNPLPEALLSSAELVEKLKAAGGDEITQMLIALRSRVEIDDALTALDRASLAQAIADRYPSLDLRAKLIALSVVPNAAMKSEFAVFDEVARKETDPAAALLAIVTRVTDKADDALVRAAASADPALKRVAALQQARLQSESPTLSRAGFRATTESSRITPSAPAPAAPPTSVAPGK